jgi:large subunit ribosomal protein L22
MAHKIAPDAQEALATAKFIRISPTKARQVVDLIRGRHVDDARRVLRFTQRGPSVTVAKVLESAVANAEHNRGLAGDELYVARAWVDEGPTLRRFRPRALGRATRIRKRTCHISVVVGRPEDTAEMVERPGVKQTVRRVRKDTAGKPAPEGAASGRSQAADAAPEPTSRTAQPTAAKKATAPKATTRKTTPRKTTRKRGEAD